MSTPSIGSFVWGEAGNICQIVSIGTKRSTGQTMLKVLCPQGQRVIPLEFVRGVSAENPALNTKSIVGDLVKLKNTKLEYVITEIYDHFMGLHDGKPSYEKWAKLQTNDGKPAQWKLNQLKVIQ